jgi:hypothetical protein
LGRLPCFHPVRWRAEDFPYPSRTRRGLRVAGPLLRSGASFSWGPGAPSLRLGLGRPGGPCRPLGAESTGSSPVPREPPCAYALLSDPGRIGPTTPLRWVEVAPAAMTTQAPATWPAFEAPSHGLCTRCLRFVPPLLTTTQDALPVGGEPLPGGVGDPRGSADRVQTSTRSPPLLGLLGATWQRPFGHN